MGEIRVIDNRKAKEPYAIKDVTEVCIGNLIDIGKNFDGTAYFLTIDTGYTIIIDADIIRKIIDEQIVEKL